MKTTLNIDDNLLSQAKTFAIREQKTLTSLIEEGLMLRLRKPLAGSKKAGSKKAGSKKKAPVLPVYKGKGGLVIDVNPLSNRAMLEAADDA